MTGARGTGATLRLRINGAALDVRANPFDRLSHILRNDLQLTGLKEGCCEGECGACTVLMDGRPVASCLVMGFQAEGAEITTVEGIAPPGTLSGLQAALLSHGAVQCGYCTPGIVMAAEGLLRADPAPDHAAIRHALAGNICRCTGFDYIVEAVAAEASRRAALATGPDPVPAC